MIGMMRKLLALCLLLVPLYALSQTKDSGLDKKSNGDIAYELTNPLSDLQLVSLQWNHDRGLGTNQAGTDQTLQFGPRFKTDVSENWNAITRVYINGVKVQNVNGVNNAGMGPTQIETFFTEKSNKETIWGGRDHFFKHRQDKVEILVVGNGEEEYELFLLPSLSHGPLVY